MNNETQPDALPVPALRLRGLSKTYAELTAVKECTLDLHAGQVLGFVGPNGAGKTTTMRCIAGILSPTSGEVFVNGHNAATDPVSAKAALAYIPDDPKLFDGLTVWEHLRFAASAYGVVDWKARAEALLKRFELYEKRDTLSMELSRGMRQKLAISSGYLHDPALILLDEPLTGLDPMGIRVMKDSIRERARAGAALMVSSHLLTLVEDLCTHVLIMAKGTQKFFGTLEDARVTFSASGEGSLEDVFFSATHEPEPPQVMPATGSKP